MKPRGKSPASSTNNKDNVVKRTSIPKGLDSQDTLLTVPRRVSESSSEFDNSNNISPYHSRLNSSTTEDARSVNNGSPGVGSQNQFLFDDSDAVSGTPDPPMTQKAIDLIQVKIDKTKELIREEQKSRDENVNEYLKLYTNADRQQQGRIKQVFEKKNQKSAQNIGLYQKKLEEYLKKQQNLQEYGIRQKGGKKLGQGLKNVGGNIRDGISGMSSTVMSKPKQFAHHIRHKFGSADNLQALEKDSDSLKNNNHGESSRQNSGSENGGVRKSSLEIQHQLQEKKNRRCISDDGHDVLRQSETGSTPSENMENSNNNNNNNNNDVSPLRLLITSPGNDAKEDEETHHPTEWKAVMQELTLHKEEVDQLRGEIDEMRQHFKQEIETYNDLLREERERYERLEEQINDLTELHQHEMENIKSGVNDMEEKVQYQSEERLIDIKEHLQSLETKVTSMEHQQVQQQYLNIEGLDTTDARALLMKLLTAGITLIHVVLFLMGTFMSVFRPFLRTTSRAVISTLIVIVGIVVYYKYDSVTSVVKKLTLRDGGKSI